ncbi:ABC transporter permease [Aquabacter spiritensis]|uniref:NitT/TauT family transport system permease protein n=1 Tax=Aquabacter spiritensis TaxID=933073 RepID=A0A4R3LZ83_9HYPH|nr:ABC transporter permease [Aquabacter spiritensis]TCT05992.1 NitT/TauT family transport system permease protein [Aquabacter spiritensis]
MTRSASPSLPAARTTGRTAPGPDAPVAGIWRGVYRRLTGDAMIQILVIAVLLIGWETVTRLGLVHPFLLPRLSAVLERIFNNMLAGKVFTDLGLTLYRAATGFLIGTAIAIPLGVLMARNTAVRWFFDPLISIGFPMPKISFLPIFILWFGIFDTSKIVMIAFSCFFPVVSATYSGTLGVDKWVIWSARSFGATPNQVLREVVLPMALPQILTGIQIAVPVGLITTVVTEMLMGGPGIGGSMIAAGRFADSVGVFAGIVEIALLGAVVVKGVERLRAYLLRWHHEARH